MRNVTTIFGVHEFSVSLHIDMISLLAKQNFFLPDSIWG